jgi:DNA-binding SARP family transcriptional activator/predicted ATPase
MNEGERGRFGGGVVVLGPVGVMSPDGTHHPVAGQQGLVLALLASAHPHPVAVDVLTDELWPSNRPRSAGTGLRVVVNRLRDRLAPIGIDGESIEFHSQAYRLELGANRLDHLVFSRAVDNPDPDDSTGRIGGSRVDTLQDALCLWRGRAFQPFEDSPRLTALAVTLEAQRCDTEERLLQAMLDEGRNDQAAVLATSLVEAEPYRERRWEQLMLALYRSGRQAEALQAATRVRSLLAEDLGVDPGPGLAKLELDILNHDPRIGSPVDSHAGPIAVAELESILRPRPATVPTTTTSYVGGADHEPIVLSESTPMVSIVGPPGVGKSRLAARYAAGLTEATPATEPHRIVWLDLVDTAAGPRPADSLRDAVAAGLDLRPTSQPVAEAVADAVGDDATLLVFDNAEHLADVVAELSEQLLEACPQLRILVTSRVALASRSERMHTLDPLPLEAAVDLLIDRAPVDAVRRFDRAELGELAERVDRLPLAIELVAPHLVSSSPAELTRRLSHTLEPATGRGRLDPRHQSMEHAIDWSVELLDHADRQLLAPIGVMAAEFPTAQLVAMLAHGADQVGIELVEATSIERSLRRLVEHGLVRASGQGPNRRWTMANTTRAYVHGRLQSQGQLATWQRRHALTHLDLALTLGTDLVGEREEEAVTALRRLGPQLSAAHRRFVQDSDAPSSAALSTAMWEYTFFRQDWARYRWLSDTLELDGVEDLEHYSEVLALAALAAWARDRLVTSAHLADRAEAVAIERGRPVPLAVYKARLNVAVHDDRPGDAAGWLDRLLAESGQRGDRRYHADNLVVAALGFAQIGFPDEAGSLGREAATLAASTGNPTSVAWARVGQAAADVQRRPERAARSYSAAARLARTVHNRWVSGMATTGLVTALRRQGRHEQARRLLLEVTELWDRARQHGLVSRCGQEAVLLLAHSDASSDDLDRAAVLIDRLDRSGFRLQLLPDDQARFEEAATILGGRDTAEGDDVAPARGLARCVIETVSR